jgi:hypothetical protein
MSSDEDKIVPVYTVRVCGGSRSKVPLIHNVGARSAWVVNVTLRMLHAEEIAAGTP